MPRPKPWVPRIPQIIEHLKKRDSTHLTRVEVEELFDIRHSAASDLMNLAGRSSTGLVSREALITYLQCSPEGQAAQQELERRRKVARVLNESAEDLKYRGVELPVTSLDEWARFRDLPDVRFERDQHGSMLIVRYSSVLDLLATLWRFVKAVGNEWQEFLKLAGEKQSSGDSLCAGAGQRVAGAGNQEWAGGGE